MFLASRLYNRFRRIPPTSTTKLHRIPFLVCFSVLVVIVLHGFSTLKIALILTLNYYIAKISSSKSYTSKLGPALTWVFNLAVLYLNETYDGYRFVHIHPSLKYMVCHYAPTEESISTFPSGRILRCLFEMGDNIQYNHAAYGVLQHGLLLGITNRL